MIINDLKNSFKQGNLLSRLIYINLGVFVIIKILGVFFFLFNLSSYEIIDLLALPAESKKLLSKPWTIITYMFVHNGFIHLIFNLLWLYFGGSIFLKYLSNKQPMSSRRWIFCLNRIDLLEFSDTIQPLNELRFILSRGVPSKCLAEIHFGNPYAWSG